LLHKYNTLKNDSLKFVSFLDQQFDIIQLMFYGYIMNPMNDFEIDEKLSSFRIKKFNCTLRCNTPDPQTDYKQRTMIKFSKKTQIALLFTLYHPNLLYFIFNCANESEEKTILGGYNWAYKLQQKKLSKSTCQTRPNLDHLNKSTTLCPQYHRRNDKGCCIKDYETSLNRRRFKKIVRGVKSVIHWREVVFNTKQSRELVEIMDVTKKEQQQILEKWEQTELQFDEWIKNRSLRELSENYSMVRDYYIQLVLYVEKYIEKWVMMTNEDKNKKRDRLLSFDTIKYYAKKAKDKAIAGIFFILRSKYGMMFMVEFLQMWKKQMCTEYYLRHGYFQHVRRRRDMQMGSSTFNTEVWEQRKDGEWVVMTTEEVKEYKDRDRKQALKDQNALILTCVNVLANVSSRFKTAFASIQAAYTAIPYLGSAGAMLVGALTFCFEKWAHEQAEFLLIHNGFKGLYDLVTSGCGDLRMHADSKMSSRHKHSQYNQLFDRIPELAKRMKDENKSADDIAKEFSTILGFSSNPRVFRKTFIDALKEESKKNI